MYKYIHVGEVCLHSLSSNTTAQRTQLNLIPFLTTPLPDDYPTAQTRLSITPLEAASETLQLRTLL